MTYVRRGHYFSGTNQKSCRVYIMLTFYFLFFYPNLQPQNGSRGRWFVRSSDRASRISSDMPKLYSEVIVG